MQQTDPPGAWRWVHRPESDAEGLLVHEPATARLREHTPGDDTVPSRWVLECRVTADGYVAWVTEQTVTADDPLTDRALRDTLTEIDDGDRHLHGLQMADPVNESFVDVLTVDVASIPDGLDPSTLKAYADAFSGVLYEDTDDGERPVDGQPDATAVGLDATHVDIEIYPTDAANIHHQSLCDGDEWCRPSAPNGGSTDG